jgi:Tektin family
LCKVWGNFSLNAKNLLYIKSKLKRKLHSNIQTYKTAFHSQTEEEIAEIEAEIRRLENAIRAKMNPMKLAQTRLENRTYRPNVELCRDNVQYGLTDEVKQLDATTRALEDKLKQAQYVSSSISLALS